MEKILLLVLALCFVSCTSSDSDKAVSRTSPDSDNGIERRLPPPVEKPDEDIKVKERNILRVSISDTDHLKVNGKECELSELKDIVKQFITPNPDDENSPETEIKTIDLLGKVTMSKGIVSFISDRGVSYKAYIDVQNELVKAFNERRDEVSMALLGKHFDALSQDETNAITKAVPVRISEAEPENYIGSTSIETLTDL